MTLTIQVRTTHLGLANGEWDKLIFSKSNDDLMLSILLSEDCRRKGGLTGEECGVMVADLVREATWEVMNESLGMEGFDGVDGFAGENVGVEGFGGGGGLETVEGLINGKISAGGVAGVGSLADVESA